MRLLKLSLWAGLSAAMLSGVTRADTLPFDAMLQDIADIRISDQGLDFLARLLGEGLLQPTLKEDIVEALEDQSFQVLIPNNLGGGTATFTVDFGQTSATPELDGFRYDDLDIELSTVPGATNLIPENGVLYPRINLNGWSGSTEADKLPELWLRVDYPPFVTGVPAVARAKLSTAGVLRPYIGAGTVGFLVERFDTQIFDFRVDFLNVLPPGVEDALGQQVMDAFAKELEDALSDVLQSGINDILFDRDLDGKADVLLNLGDLLEGLNDAFNTDFGFTLDPVFQTNATSPTTVLLRTNGSMFLRSAADDCVGPDIDAGFLYTLLEADGVFGHDPPLLTVAPPGTTAPAQFVVSLSDDFLNQILFNGYRTGLGCIFLDPLSSGLATDVVQLLTTDSLELFVGDWLQEQFPDAPVGLRFRLLERPWARIPADDEYHLDVRLPSTQIDLMVFDRGRWVRLMGAQASFGLKAALLDVSLTGSQLIRAEFDFSVSSTVNYAELVPTRREDLEIILPTAVSLAEGAVADLLDAPAGNVTDCVGGLDISDFDASPLGIDPGGEFAHYLGAWFSFSGSVDLGQLFECLLGAPLVADGDTTGTTTGVTTAPAIEPPLRLATGISPHRASDLAGAPVRAWRFEPGFVHRGAEPVPALPKGVRTWAWEGLDGQWRRLRLVGGRPAPRWRAERTGDGWIIRVDAGLGAPVAPALRYIRDGQVVTRGAGVLHLAAADVDRMGVLDYTDRFGRSFRVPVADVLPATPSGCTTGGAGTPTGPVAVLLLAWLLVQRRRYSRR